MGEVRCNGCRDWFDAAVGNCPDCGLERPEPNRGLRTAALNRNLYDQAALATADNHLYQRTLRAELDDCKRYGIEPGGYPTREQVGQELKALEK